MNVNGNQAPAPNGIQAIVRPAALVPQGGKFDITDQNQIETATIVGTIIVPGNAKLVFTAAGMTNSPKTVTFAVDALDNASAVAGKARTAAGLDADVSAFFTVGGAGATVELTVFTGTANDPTMNIASANDTCTGLTAQPTSANTQAGIDLQWTQSNRRITSVGAFAGYTFTAGDLIALPNDDFGLGVDALYKISSKVSNDAIALEAAQFNGSVPADTAIAEIVQYGGSKLFTVSGGSAYIQELSGLVTVEGTVGTPNYNLLAVPAAVPLVDTATQSLLTAAAPITGTLDTTIFATGGLLGALALTESTPDPTSAIVGFDIAGDISPKGSALNPCDIYLISDGPQANLEMEWTLRYFARDPGAVAQAR